ncbi:MAG: PepSY-associated TM helix domain-containing protein [Bacteroidota bacterium]
MQRSTWFQWKKTTRWKRKNYDLHNILGFYAFFIFIFIVLTGLMWAFMWFNNGVQWVANGGETPEKEKIEVVSTPSAITLDHPLDVAHNYLKIQHAQAEVYYISLPQDSVGTIGTFAHYSDNTRDMYLQFDQYTGEKLASKGWEGKTNGEKVWAYNYDIHVEAIWGLPGKILAFFLSLISVSLSVTGFIIWWGRRKTKRAQRKTTPTGYFQQAALPKPIIPRSLYLPSRQELLHSYKGNYSGYTHSSD